MLAVEFEQVLIQQVALELMRHRPGHEPAQPSVTATTHPGEGVAEAIGRLQNESVPNILVRDLPDDVHRVLQDRAEHRGQSLQQYLSSELTRLAARPTADELFERVSKRRGGKVGLAQAVADLEAERSVA